MRSSVILGRSRRVVVAAGRVRIVWRNYPLPFHDHRHRAPVEADMEAVRRAGAEIGTPSFFIDGSRSRSRTR